MSAAPLSVSYISESEIPTLNEQVGHVPMSTENDVPEFICEYMGWEQSPIPPPMNAGSGPPPLPMMYSYYFRLDVGGTWSDSSIESLFDEASGETGATVIGELVASNERTNVFLKISYSSIDNNQNQYLTIKVSPPSQDSKNNTKFKFVKGATTDGIKN